MNKLKALTNKVKREKQEKTAKKPRVKQMSFLYLSLRDQIFLIKRLAFLIRAGVPLVESLHMIREQTKGRSSVYILDTVIADVSGGQYLSKSLERYRNMFGDFSINIISVGEASGILSQNLEYLAEELRKKHALRKKVLGSFIYPAIITVATLAITIFLTVYLFPKILPIFSSINMELPITTRALIFASDAIRSYWLVGILGIAAFFVAFLVMMKKNHRFHFLVDNFLIRAPLIGKIVKDYNMANCTRTLGLLIKSGITLSEAVPITAKTSNNLVYKREFQNLSGVVDRGEKISTYLKKKSKLFPEVVPQIISVGEKSGSLSDSLIYLSELYEAEVEDFTKNLSNLIEPVLMIFMGILVGFIAVSIITPIYSITQHLSPR